MNFDDAMRDFRSYVDATRTPAAVRPMTDDRSERRRHAPVRVAGWTAAGAAVVGAALLTAVAVRTASTPPSQAPVIAPARVDWGMVGTVRVTPDPGVGPDEAVARTIEALRTRAAARDLAGFDAVRSGIDTIRIRIPAASANWQLTEFVRFDRFAVVDTSHAVVAAGPRLTLLEAPARAAGTPGAGVRYWVAPNVRSSFSPIPFATRAAAIRAHPYAATARGVRPVPIPRDLTVAAQTSSRGRAFVILRRERILDSRDVVHVVANAGALEVTVDDQGAARLSSANRPAVLLTEIGGQETLYPDAVVTGDSVRVAMDRAADAAWISFSLSAPGVPGTLTLASSTAYGRQPPQTGDPYVLPERPTPFGLPGTIQTSFDRPLSARRVLEADVPVLGRMDLVIVKTRRGDELAQLMTNKGSGGGGSCQIEPGAPVVQVCWLSAIPDAPRTRDTIVQYIGRTAPDVRSVQIRFPSGATARGPAAHGWFYVAIHLPAGRGDEIVDPIFTAMAAGGRVVFDGIPVALTSPPFNSNSLAAQHEMNEYSRTAVPAFTIPKGATSSIDPFSTTSSDPLENSPTRPSRTSSNDPFSTASAPPRP